MIITHSMQHPTPSLKVPTVFCQYVCVECRASRQRCCHTDYTDGTATVEEIPGYHALSDTIYQPQSHIQAEYPTQFYNRRPPPLLINCCQFHGFHQLRSYTCAVDSISRTYTRWVLTCTCEPISSESSVAVAVVTSKCVCTVCIYVTIIQLSFTL